jgi:SAM-dependent methyltransferase
MDENSFEYQGLIFPSYLKAGRAADYIIPIASQFCKGNGLDIGGTPECRFPGAKVINTSIPDGFHATNLPNEKYDFIFSSHTLEHVENYLETLLYWRAHLKEGGVLFLYLPHPDMRYWHPSNCKKHRHSFAPSAMILALQGLGFKNVSCSQRDLFWSFAIAGYNQIE